MDVRGSGLSEPSSSRRVPGLIASVCGLVGMASGLLSVNVEEGSMEDNVFIDVVDCEGLGMIGRWVGELVLTWWVERESAGDDVTDPGEVNDKPREGLDVGAGGGGGLSAAPPARIEDVSLMWARRDMVALLT